MSGTRRSGRWSTTPFAATAPVPPRAAIVATWTAVCTDIIHKLYQLAEDGDGKAAEIVAKLNEARGKLDGAAIKIVEDVEKKLLEDALDLELIDGIEHRQLLRLKEDRNLCAHPATCGWWPTAGQRMPSARWGINGRTTSSAHE
ncbi:hypothetical protein GCM10020000_86180 [Streptomyces olivoverticillatus]